MKKFIYILVSFIVTISANAQMVTTYDGLLGETVAYDVGSFTDVRDKTLEDVLNKMPGVAVLNGRISAVMYNGMTVGKIFINGTDLRSSFKMVAGIKPEDIERVEFVENFQAVKVLRNKQYSSIAAINIILKEGADSGWSGSARLGLGVPWSLYDGDIYALRVSPNSQNMVNVKTNSSGLDLSSSISSFAADNIGLTVDYFSLSSYIDISPSTSPLAEQRKRFNNSTMLNTVNTFRLSDNFQLFSQFSYLNDNNEAENSEETVYYLNDGSTIVEHKGEYASSTENQLKTNIALISNTDDYYLVNHIFARASWQERKMTLSGTYPNEQVGELTSINAKNDFRFLKPIGDWNLTIFSQNQFMSTPQNVFVERVGSQQNQQVNSNALFSDTKVSFGYTTGMWTISLVGAFDAVNRQLSSELTGVADMEVEDNNSEFGYINSYIQPTVNLVSDRVQLQVGLPVKFYHYWFDDFVNGDKSTKNITNFEPSFSLKYEVSPLLSVTLDGVVEYDRVNAGSFYTGMILTNYRRIREGSLKYDLDGERSINAAYSFKLPERSFFLSGRAGYQVGRSMYRTYDNFIGDYVVSGFLPQETDTRYFYGHVDANKGITSLRGSIGIWAGYTNTDRTMIRNDEEVLFNTQVVSFRPNIQGRLASWFQVVYEFTSRNTVMKISNVSTKSRSNSYNQTLEMILTPTNNLNFSILGEHYHTIISGGQSKNLILADVKAEYQITPRWQLMGTVTNILNQKDYSYNVISDLTSSHTSYIIRPRNFLLSVYYKF